MLTDFQTPTKGIEMNTDDNLSPQSDQKSTQWSMLASSLKIRWSEATTCIEQYKV